MSKTTIDEKEYFQYTNIIKIMVKQKKYDEAKNMLLEIIESMERYSYKKGEGVSPWYYEELSKVYKYMKNPEEEIKILRRYLTQIKAGGVSGKKIFDKYIEKIGISIGYDPREEIYNEYLVNLHKLNKKTKEAQCSACGMKVEFLKSGNINLIRSTCPFCFENNLFIFE
jgi:hypothetical protein